METRKTIVLVLRSGGDFAMRDVELIARHINGKWRSPVRPRIICLWDKASTHYDLGNMELMPLTNDQPGTWSRIALYAPEMEQYRPFLYIDLDTVVIQSLENIFALVTDPSQFITLEDFWRPTQLATGLAWIPANSVKVKRIWESYQGPTGKRMDYYIQTQIKHPDAFWQQLTDTIFDFKPRTGMVLRSIPDGSDLICFHGKPRIFAAGESSVSIDWVRHYINQRFVSSPTAGKTATVIIPYNKDRGWLNEAISSLPEGIQLILSKGDGNWPQNFNRVLDQVEGDYVRWLHEDDMLTPNSIDDSINAIEDQGVDFIHGNAIEITPEGKTIKVYRPRIKVPSLSDLTKKNVFHSAAMMYRRRVFDELKGLNEDKTLYGFEELEFNLRCLKAGYKVGYCDAELGIYRRHPGQIIRTVNAAMRNTNRAELIKSYS